MIRTKRWNDEAEPDDGYRLLVTRYRPRGVPREGEPWNAWCAALGPSVELHAAVYGKRGAPPIGWEEYARRYEAEVTKQGYWLDGFAERVARGEALTLLCSSACLDPTRCHRTILARLLTERAAARNAPPAEKPRVRRR